MFDVSTRDKRYNQVTLARDDVRLVDTSYGALPGRAADEVRGVALCVCLCVCGCVYGWGGDCRAQSTSTPVRPGSFAGGLPRASRGGGGSFVGSASGGGGSRGAPRAEMRDMVAGALVENTSVTLSSGGKSGGTDERAPLVAAQLRESAAAAGQAFTFRDYEPHIFRSIREFYGVTLGDYTRALTAVRVCARLCGGPCGVVCVCV